jgi:transcriptional regulator with XRE-family HTH domain
MLAPAPGRPVSLGVAPPITTAQIRAARGLLKWTQATLAARAGLSAVTLNMIENETVRPRESTLAAIRHALEAGGVRFLMEDGVGVRFASAAANAEGDD